MSERYYEQAMEIIGMCDSVLTKDNTPKEVEELVKKIANKLDLIVSSECEECEYMQLEDCHDPEPSFMKEELD